MKIIATSDWHLGNLFHGHDRLPEHKHFLTWLLEQIREQKPDALLIAGDVFDNGNPSAASQSAYYEFLSEAIQAWHELKIIITAGNHDSATRLEAPRPLLARHRIEVRGSLERMWMESPLKNGWQNNYKDLMIPLQGCDGTQALVLAVPYLRSDRLSLGSYSEGVKKVLQELTAEARKLYPERIVLMMAHMYAQGADIATTDASEKIIIGGQEEVCLEGWNNHPDYLTCGHIHKRQHIWHTDWAHYTGSILPMSFAEINYRHGVDLLTIQANKAIQTDFLEYIPQHPLCIIPDAESALPPKGLIKAIRNILPPRSEEGTLSESFRYVVLRVKMEQVDNNCLRELEEEVEKRDAVLCKIQKVLPNLDLTTFTDHQQLTSIEDILNRDPMDTLRESFILKHNRKLSEQQEAMLQEVLSNLNEVKP